MFGVKFPEPEFTRAMNILSALSVRLNNDAAQDDQTSVAVDGRW